MSEDHAEDKFVDTFMIVLLLLVALTVALVLIARAVAAVGQSSDVPSEQVVRLIAERVKPVAQVAIAGKANAGGTESAGQAAAAAPGEPGQATYQSACFTCHGAGIAGAPKFGDAAAWAPRLAKGVETLHQHSLQGFNAMPPKGGFVNLSDDEVKQAVDYMVKQVQ